jgi:HK97 family phage portal protein
VIGLFRKPETRSLDASKFGLATDMTEYNTAGVSVTQDTALSLSAVFSAVRLLSNDMGSLPMDVFHVGPAGRSLIEPAPSWIEEPNPWNPNETGIDHRSQVGASLVLDGNAFVYAVPNVFNPVELHVLNPRQIDVETDRRGAPSYIVRGRDGRTTIDTLDPLNCLHITLFRVPGNARGLSPIEAMKQGIGRGMAAEEAGARLFGQGTLINGLVEYPKEAADPDPEQVKELLRGLNRRHKGIKNAWALGALTGGATFHELTLKPKDAQAIETEEWTLEQFARTLGIPPSMLGSQKPGAVAYASVEQRSIDYVVHAVVPIVIRLEKAYSRLLPPGAYIKFNVTALMRGDAKARAEFYQIALQNKWMTRDEVRVLEDMNPMGLGFLETPNNNASDPRIDAAGALVRAGYLPDAAAQLVGLGSIPHLGLPPVTVQAPRPPRQEAPTEPIE